MKELNELSLEEQRCVLSSIESLKLAYAPYSKFRVGAAVLLSDGGIFQGANQENASYPLCMCAERTALYNLSMYWDDQNIKCIAITAKHPEKILKEHAMPCGACRQVISEYEFRNQAPIKILLVNESHQIVSFNSIKDLLPYSFDPDVLI